MAQMMVANFNIFFKTCGLQKLNANNEKNRKEIIANITKIISLPSTPGSFCLDDPNLTKSVNLSILKHQMTKSVNLTMRNLTKNILDQKDSNLCVPISVATLLRHAMKNDLGFHETNSRYSAEKILATITIIVYPRSMVGLNLNPNNEERSFQLNQIELLLERICKKTYLMETGWGIIRLLDNEEKDQPNRSTCEYEKGINHNFSQKNK